MKFALIGYGKMGKTIEEVIMNQNQAAGNRAQDEIVLKITDQNLDDFTIENLKRADVAIEFTQPDSAVGNIYKCFEANIPVVVGTTAWRGKLEEVKRKCAACNGALFFSPNFSIGVNIFFELNRRLALLMNNQEQYNVHIEEIHHTEKKDAPSGTAIKTAEVIMQELKRKNSWKLADDNNSEIPVSNNAGADSLSHDLLIVAKRKPDYPGTHIVTYTSSVDTIELKHEAKSRKGFAEGAVMAARWVVGKSGVFEMKDLLQP